MSTLEDFLTDTEEAEIVEAIRVAEKNTSGEIRVHLENNCQDAIYEHALEVFHYLKMDNTKLKNGVLIYVAINSKSFVICGDKGINASVGKQFWDTTRNTMQQQFKDGNFKQGIIYGITEAGKALSKHFPWKHNDIDELDNSISKQ